MNETLLERISERKIAFFGVFFVIFSLSYLVLLALDFYPEPKIEEPAAEFQPETAVINEAAAQELPAGVLESPLQPTSLYIKKLDRTVKVLNPSSKTVADLDAALLGGVVRHPDSALMGQKGNVLLLGHSSYLPSVLNKNFQAFNGIQNLEWGDTIELRTSDRVVVYQVEKVYQAKATEVTVPVTSTGALLTLATCNSFGSKDDRFIVEARAVETRNL